MVKIGHPTGNLCREFGTYMEKDGLSLRGSFIADPDGVLQAMEICSNNIGRSTAVLLRKQQAAQFVREHGGEVCPANGKPGMELIGKI